MKTAGSNVHSLMVRMYRFHRGRRGWRAQIVMSNVPGRPNMPPQEREGKSRKETESEYR